MTIYERLFKIRDTYINNANACYNNNLISAYQIIMTSADALTDYIESMPVEIAEMYAGENE